jgi:C4-dicarboxylate transporter, DctQ subunit
MPERKQHLISRIAGWLDRALELTQSALLASAVLAMAALNIANVVGRNLLNYSLPFAGELNQLLIVLITFLGVGYAARFRRHIRMSAFSEQLRGVLTAVPMFILAADIMTRAPRIGCSTW